MKASRSTKEFLSSLMTGISIEDVDPIIMQYWIDHPQELRGYIIDEIKSGPNVLSFVLPDFFYFPGYFKHPSYDGEAEFIGKKVVLRFVDFFKPNEVAISGDEMMSRIKRLGPLAGIRSSSYLSRHSSIVPQRLRHHDFVFAGTLWPENHFQVFTWDGREWRGSFLSTWNTEFLRNSLAVTVSIE